MYLLAMTDLMAIQAGRWRFVSAARDTARRICAFDRVCD
jgi:hypothetical protein